MGVRERVRVYRTGRASIERALACIIILVRAFCPDYLPAESISLFPILGKVRRSDRLDWTARYFS